ncbi:hypothetical protein J437_LFUL008295 [Ladona fulva]|uniref:Uncharacterized protein n=1 Tax=Ladona fulva TaxID=123851 RepID=A0A8K0K6X1_LADFU|nr:hypothetical protein J437_LFUL008295 [Ladona fulva]
MDKNRINHASKKELKQVISNGIQLRNLKIKERKIMASIFWDWKGISLVDFMPKGTTINAAAYSKTLKKLKKKSKARGGEC